MTERARINCPLPALREEYESHCMVLVMNAIMKHRYNKAAAAKELGINRTTLQNYLKKNRPELIVKRPKGIRTPNL